MDRLYYLLVISAALVFTNCTNYRSLFPKNRPVSAEEMASHIKTGKFYKILLKDETTAFIRVRRIEGTTIYGKLRTVDAKYYPIKDSSGKVIVNPEGSVNLNDAKNIKKRRSIVVMAGVPLVVTVGFFAWFVSLGSFTLD